jgi:hypothetical protein
MKNTKYNLDKIINKIVSHEYNFQELKNLYSNAIRLPDIPEEDLERLVEAIESEMRVNYSAKAVQIFGHRDEEGRKRLEKLYADIVGEFDLSKNTVKNGLKTGGLMISGIYHVDIYFSYKNAEKWNVSLNWLQEKIEDKPIVRVRLYQGGENNPDGRIVQVFEVTELPQALATYQEILRSLIDIS